ncbi:MAG: WYL domain-containing protein [Clostridiales bacterium]|jgi:hypothetical protein|nr:WYL domain-containing protein [Clostridiales bacterium]
MSALFSEIYGCYFGIVSRVLNAARDGISKKDIESIIAERGFSETAFHLLPGLIGGEWSFLERRGDLYYSKFDGGFERPLTRLELSWLAALTNDPRIGLFLSGESLTRLRGALKETTPAFDAADFVSADKRLDGDPYGDAVYIANFREILKACKGGYPVAIAYAAEKTGVSERTYYPFKLSYSELDDKFRLLCAVFDAKAQKPVKRTLNLGRVISAAPSGLNRRISREELCRLFLEQSANPPITLEITNERNAPERFFLQFASFDRKTEYDRVRGVYTCQISYDLDDEAELLIRILSFGPTVRVLGPQGFLDKIKERLIKQFRLCGGER